MAANSKVIFQTLSATVSTSAFPPPPTPIRATSKPSIVSKKTSFFNLEDFAGPGDFLAKVHTYQRYFNIARPSSHKQNLTPWQIIKRLASRSPLELCLLPPVSLDYYLNDSRDAMRVGFPSTPAESGFTGLKISCADRFFRK